MEIWTLLTDTNSEAGGIQCTAVKGKLEHKVVEFFTQNICVCVRGEGGVLKSIANVILLSVSLAVRHFNHPG